MSTLDYFRKLINDYYMSYDEKKKETISKNISILYHHIDPYDFKSKDYYAYIKKRYLRFIKENGNVQESGSSFNEEGINSYYKNANEDLYYLRELLKHIKVDTSRVNLSDNLGSINDLEEYIKSNKEFYNLYKSNKYDTILDYNYTDGDATSIKFINKYIMILSNKNMSIMLHELMHIFNENSVIKYHEMTSILPEMGFTREYNTKPDFDRIVDINNLNYLKKESINNWNNYTIYYYGIGTIIAIAFLNKYGNNFNNIMYLNEFVHKNPTISLKKLFNELNISDDEVIYSTNNMKKILVNRQ